MPAFPTAEYPTPPSSQRILPVATLLAGLATACAAHRTIDLPSRPTHSLPQRQSHHGMSIAAVPVDTEDAVGRHFGEEVWDAGLFAVILYVENRGASPASLRRREMRVHYRTADRPPLESVPPETVLTECRPSSLPVWLTSPLVIPAVWLHRERHRYCLDQTEDLGAKSFPDAYRWEPGDPSYRAAVFFRRPVDQSLHEALQNAELRLTVEIEGTQVDTGDVANGLAIGQTIELVLPLGGASS